jgi:uncharacterized repeat protein (TIGR03803 family)
VNPATGAERVLHPFNISDGANPEASLISVGARLYGVINAGGAVDSGVAFSVNPETGAVNVLRSFQGGTDGATPSADLIQVGGMLYGTTEFGGSTNCGGNGCGTVFSLDLTTGAERIVHSFQGGADGSSPVASLIQVGGILYGTTFEGGDSTNCGSNACGTVFSLNLSTGVETTVYSFKGGNDGSSPSASLIEVGRTFYGTTHSGGSSNDGTVFSLDPTTGAEKIVHSLQSSDGVYPSASLILVGGKLYGTTQSGGTTNCSCGTVFALTPSIARRRQNAALTKHLHECEAALGEPRIPGSFIIRNVIFRRIGHSRPDLLSTK